MLRKLKEVFQPSNLINSTNQIERILKIQSLTFLHKLQVKGTN